MVAVVVEVVILVVVVLVKNMVVKSVVVVVVVVNGELLCLRIFMIVSEEKVRVTLWSYSGSATAKAI